MPTSRDVARHAGVSQSTVSRALASHPGVADDLRARVLAAARELRYRPNEAARAMRTSRSGNIGVVTARLANPLYPELLQLLSRELSAAGQRMVVWNTEDADGEAAVDVARSGGVDGVVFTTATEGSARLYRALTERVPVALVNRTIAGWPCDQVESDNRGGGRAVAAYFAAGERRRVGLVAGPREASTIRNREDGFREGLEAAGLGLEHGRCIRVEGFSYRSGFEAARRLLDLAAPPDAVFCVNDVLALGARDAARSLGVPLPEALWLVGYDDVEMASWTAFDLTTVRQPLAEMAAHAVRLLLRRIRGGGAASHEHLVLANPLVVRGSTSRHPVPAPADAPGVAA
jgi:LacI family transcriptional regulator